MDAQLEQDLRSIAPLRRGLCYAMRAMVRMLKLGSALAWLAFIGLGLQACSTDDTIVGTARGPKNLAIERVEALGSVVEESGGTLALDCSAPMLVWIGPYDAKTDKLGDFYLAPPGDCGTLTDCGWIVLSQSSSPHEVQSLQSPIEFNLPADPRTGPVDLRTAALTLRVELRDVWGDPVLADDGKSLFAEFTLNLTPETCP